MWVLCWATVAVLFGGLSAVLISVLGVLVHDGSPLLGLASDLLSVTPFVALLVGVPALAALAVGRAVQGRRRHTAGPPP